MRFPHLIIWCFFCLTALWADSQPALTIYADQEKNDTLAKLIVVLKQQLRKSQPFSISDAPAARFAGKGIYLGAAPASFAVSDPEAFSVSADGKSVRILGNTNMAIRHGVFSWLESLGYRFYFANPDWHIIPSIPDIYRQVNLNSNPDFSHRRIWYGYGTGSRIADEDYNFWMIANKQGGTMNAYFGHSYGNIVARNKAAFQQHPEWFYPAPARGVIPADPKFDMSNEALVQLVIKDVENQIEASLKNGTAAYKMISVAPSDGVGTCNTPACRQLGTVTDRVFYLVNRVAKAIAKKYPSTLVGCLAYSEYSEPPTIKLEPNVFVGITTAFNNSNYATAELIDRWRRKGAVVGIYDYFSWYMWDYDVPGQSQASKISTLEKNIKRYYDAGIKAYDAESSIGWIDKGLGYYIAAKMMWDVKVNVEDIKREFFTNCFGKAAAEMRTMWQSWEEYPYAAIRESDLAQWIDQVSRAEELESDASVRKRIFQIKSYLHYLFLYRKYLLEKTETNLLPLLNYGYRKLDDGSVAGYPAIFAIGARSKIKGMAFTADAKWRANNNPVTQHEINRLIRADREELKTAAPVKAFLPVAKFTTVPGVTKYAKLMADSSRNNNAFWLLQEFVMEIKSKTPANYIELTGDYVANPNNKKPIRVNVYPYSESGDVAGTTPVLTYNYNSKQVKEKISLAGLQPGYYTVLVEDPTKIFRINFSRSINYSAVSRPSRQLQSRTLDYAFIYVPPGVKVFNVIKNKSLELITPAGRSIKLKDNKIEDMQVDVRAGESGLWRIKLADRLHLEGIPPYIGTSASQMLIPAENR